MYESKIRAERIAEKVRRKQRLVRVAMGQEKADLVLKNATYVNVFSNELSRGDIAVANGLVVGMGTYSGAQEVDVSGKVVAPGLIDAHIHLESTMMTPFSFAEAALPHGTTTVVCDPHEIANVSGAAGIDYMLSASEGLPLDVHFMLPGCVPSMAFEENGASLSWRDINGYFDHPRVLGLAEMMNYPGVIAGERQTLEKIIVSQAHHKKIDGHAPGVNGHALDAYMSAGVYSDHECYSLEDALEKLRKGQFIMIREGTAARNLDALMPLLTWQYGARCMFCTDDLHPLDLLKRGHIDHICRRAVAAGADPILTVKMASHHAARYFLLNNKGGISPGYLADFVVFDNLRDFNAQMVFKRGKCVWDGKKVTADKPQVDADIFAQVTNTFSLPPITGEKLKKEGELPVIRLLDGSIATENGGTVKEVNPEKGILKLATAERYRHTGHVGVCYVENYGLKRGAVATSVSHDSHNLVGCGASDEDLCLAMNRVRDMSGGIAVAENGRIVAEMPLPIGGLFADLPATTVSEQLEACKDAAYGLGAHKGVDPFMTLSFTALPVIPALRLTTLGVFDVNHQTFI